MKKTCLTLRCHIKVRDVNDTAESGPAVPMIAQRFLLCTFEYLREIENIFKKWLAYDYSRWVSIMKVNEGQKLCCNVFLNCFCCCCCKSKYSRKSCKYQFGTKLSLCPPPTGPPHHGLQLHRRRPGRGEPGEGDPAGPQDRQQPRLPQVRGPLPQAALPPLQAPGALVTCLLAVLRQVITENNGNIF